MTLPAWLLAIAGAVLLALVMLALFRTLYGRRHHGTRDRRLGGYTILNSLGRGGMAEVFVARHAQLCRPTALKVLRATGKLDRRALTRFEREVQLASSLTHPNTVRIYDFGRADDALYFTMEYLEGMDIQKLVDRFGPLPAARVVFILRQICGALSEAHDLGVVHRDLKPSNIFLTVRGGLYDFVKVLDFGIAARIESEHGWTEGGHAAIVGTPLYIAPEMISAGRVDRRSDIYQLGGIAYFTLTGRPPFSGDSTVELLRHHLETVPLAPSQLSELPVSDEFDRLVLRCLAKRPEDRFQNVAEMDSALRGMSRSDPWSFQQAREWWKLHMARDEFVAACFACLAEY